MSPTPAAPSSPAALAHIQGFLAALHHDAGKLWLSQDTTPPKAYGKWGDHVSWDTTQPSPLDPEVHTLIKLMEGQTRRKLADVSDERLRDLETVGVVSLRAADALHKALYWGDDAKLGQVHVGLQCPFYYPFYGHPKVWGPDKSLPPSLHQTFNVHVLLQSSADRTAAARRPEWANARQQFQTFLDQLTRAHHKPDGLQAQDLERIQAEVLGAFPESTFLPVTSLGFHQRFVAALFLLLYQTVQHVEFRQRRHVLEVRLCLNTVVTPPERLTNRLRDTTVVRKISHLLQQRFHDYCRERYLTPLAALRFQHPDTNPCFFYNKDAIVLLNRAEEQADLTQICEDVARTTESVLTLATIPIHGTLTLELATDPPPPTLLSQLSLPEFKRVVRATATLGKQTTHPCWGPSTFTPEQAAETVAYHCAPCNKASDVPLAEDVGDPCCPTCLRFRRNFRICTRCQVYYEDPPRHPEQGGGCPSCGHHDHRHRPHQSTPRLLRGGGRGEGEPGYRVAYVLVKVRAAYDTIREEADALMAQFRTDRDAWERGTEGEKEALRWTLARTRPTHHGLFEYLQAAQDLQRFQDDVKADAKYALLSTRAEQLRLGWAVDWQPTPGPAQEEASLLAQRLTEEEQRRKGTRQELRWTPRVPQGHYPITPEDYTDQELVHVFLYRSPLLTLLVLPEVALPVFYQRLRYRLRALRLSQSLRLVTCRYNYPVWMVLRHLGLHETPDPLHPPEERRAWSKTLGTDQQQLDGDRETMFGTREHPGPLEGIRRDLHSALGKHKDKASAPPALQTVDGQDFHYSGKFLTCTPQEVKAWLTAPQFAELQHYQQQARDHTAQIWTASAALQQLTQEHWHTLDTQRRLTVLRSGIERTFTGEVMDTLLSDPPDAHVTTGPNRSTTSQIGNVAAIASQLLTEMSSAPDAAHDHVFPEAFRRHLLMELAASTREGRKTLIPPKVVQSLHQWIEVLPPEALPGFLRELVRWWSLKGARRRQPPPPERPRRPSPARS